MRLEVGGYYRVYMPDNRSWNGALIKVIRRIKTKREGKYGEVRVRHIKDGRVEKGFEAMLFDTERTKHRYVKKISEAQALAEAL